MKKIKWATLFTLAVVLMAYNYYLRPVNLAGLAKLQLQDSEVAYGVGSGLASSNTGMVINGLVVLIMTYLIIDITIFMVRRTKKKGKKATRKK